MDIQEMQTRRKELGYTYRMISELADLPLPTVQKVLGGFTKSPRYETIKALEKVLAPVPSQRDGTQMEKKDSLSPPTYGPLYSGIITAEPQTAYRTGDRGGRARNVPGPNQSCYPLLPQKRQGEYTAADRESLPEEVHTELIDGVIYDMASPKYAHQILVTELLTRINSQIEKCGRDCLAFSAPSDVWLTGDDRNVFRPDIFVVCDYGMLGEEGYVTGAPPFIIEVLSPSTRSRDLLLKAFKYHEAGVREYWIVDPDEYRILVYNYDRDPDGTVNMVYSFTEDVPVGISDGKCSINLQRAKKILDRIRGL
ncbi:MAG: Uma2 family endonuclease [Eubacteriales bacterium]|nr:Uma2 family endonuclease [Eubacteriales bacterium]